MLYDDEEPIEVHKPARSSLQPFAGLLEGNIILSQSYVGLSGVCGHVSNTPRAEKSGVWMRVRRDGSREREAAKNRAANFNDA